MALWEVNKIFGGQRLADGKIDFDIIADEDGTGPKRMIYTWDPDDEGAPLADEITALFMSNTGIVIKEYVWQPPTEVELRLRMLQEFRKMRLNEYTQWSTITNGAEKVPDEVVAKALHARQTYHNFVANPETIPQDWEDAKYWTQE